jgi:hypothetical protein
MRWPVIPLAHPMPRQPLTTGYGCSCGQRACLQPGAHPIEAAQTGPSRDAATLSTWWARAPYNIGLPTGCALDVLDVPVGIGAVALGILRATGSTAGPVLNVGDRYQFLVRAGASIEVRATLDDAGLSASELRLRYRGSGDVLVAPPSTLPHTTTHWVIEPDLAKPELPDALAVLPELVRAGLRTVRVRS